MRDVPLVTRLMAAIRVCNSRPILRCAPDRATGPAAPAPGPPADFQQIHASSTTAGPMRSGWTSHGDAIDCESGGLSPMPGHQQSEGRRGRKHIVNQLPGKIARSRPGLPEPDANTRQFTIEDEHGVFQILIKDR